MFSDNDDVIGIAKLQHSKGRTLCMMPHIMFNSFNV